MRYAFVSGNPALDLAGTRKWRGDTEPEELLREPADLRHWFDEAEGFPSGLRIDRDDLETALLLREAVYGLARDRLRGAPYEPDLLATVNELAARPGLRPKLTAAGVSLTGTARDAVADLARSAIAVLSDPGAHLKECGRPTCTRIYVDRSRGARRTWCGMDECGNRVKAAAYRARKRAAAEA